jgi:hypothetical protein
MFPKKGKVFPKGTGSEHSGGIVGPDYYFLV